jgi:ABC-type nitrate/sulfonate/bicarbonate transport system substrate-binding protein
MTPVRLALIATAAAGLMAIAAALAFAEIVSTPDGHYYRLVPVRAPAPGTALDKVKFATNWLADPEAGGFFQAVADGTYAKYGLDVTISRRPADERGADAAVRQDRLFVGGDLIYKRRRQRLGDYDVNRIALA